MGQTIRVHEIGGGGGGAPTGPAGGDLSGNYPNPTIATNAVKEDEVGNLSGGSDGDFIVSDGNGNFKYQGGSTVKMEAVFKGEDFTIQEPTALNTPITIKFGGAQTTTYFDLSASGVLTCKVEGSYVLRRVVQFGRTGAGGVSQLLGRLLVNGVQEGASAYGELDDADVTIPSGGWGVFDLSAGDTISFELVRDGGSNSGGLYPYNAPTTTGWNASASAQLIAYRIIGNSAVSGGSSLSLLEGVSAALNGGVDLAGNTKYTQDITVTGAVVGDKVDVGLSDLLSNDLTTANIRPTYYAWVVSANTVRVAISISSFLSGNVGYTMWCRIVK